MMRHYIAPISIFVILVIILDFLSWLVNPGLCMTWQGALIVTGAAAVGVATVLGGVVPLLNEFRDRNKQNKRPIIATSTHSDTISSQEATLEGLTSEQKSQVKKFVSNANLEKALDVLIK